MGTREVERFELLTEDDAPVLNEALDNIIVADNLPKVSTEKIDKLKTVLKKVFSQFGEIVDFFLCQDKENNTTGFAFIEYATKEQARKAVEDGNGYKLDKRHIFSVILMSEFDKYEKTPEQFVAPEEDEYTEEPLTYWLENRNCDDQYVIRHGQKTAVLWNKKESAKLIQERNAWTETYVQWSPQGSYMATFHRQGIALWGGPEWKRLQRFSHRSVKYIDFSPCERYLVTWSSEVADSEEDPNAIVVWDIKSGQAKRRFSARNVQFLWPFFKWSHDDKYFAQLNDDTLFIYETPKMNRVKTIKVFGDHGRKNLQENGTRVTFAWSPSDNVLAYWVPEEGQRPARVVLVKVPKMDEIAIKNLFNVKECRFYWQQSGDHLCVQVDRFTKSKKGQFTNFEIFHLREKLVPCDLLELKEKVDLFAWEPKGKRFGIVHGVSPRINASFYELQAAGVILLKVFEKVSANAMFWSPRGQFCVLAGLNLEGNVMGGALSFIDANDMSIMNQAEHMMMTDLEWDPTGRYVTTAVSNWREKSDNGYYVWSFQGRPLQRHNIDKFFQLMWRPRPKSLLSEEDEKRIAADKKYNSIFEAEDRMTQSAASDELKDQRRSMNEDWEAYRSSLARTSENVLEQLAKMRPDYVEMPKTILEEEIVLFVKEETEVLDKLDI